MTVEELAAALCEEYWTSKGLKMKSTWNFQSDDERDQWIAVAKLATSLIVRHKAGEIVHQGQRIWAAMASHISRSGNP